MKKHLQQTAGSELFPGNNRKLTFHWVSFLICLFLVFFSQDAHEGKNSMTNENVFVSILVR